MPLIEQQNTVANAAYTTQIKLFLCPGRLRQPVAQSKSQFVISSSNPNIHNGWWPTDYAINVAAFPGCYVEDEVTGVVPVLTQLNLLGISDGTSNTIWGGEKSLSIQRYGVCTDWQWDEAAFYGGFGGTGRTGCRWSRIAGPAPAVRTLGDAIQRESPFAFYDGHVASLRFGLDLTNLLTSSGGEAINNTD